MRRHTRRRGRRARPPRRTGGESSRSPDAIHARIGGQRLREPPERRRQPRDPEPPRGHEPRLHRALARAPGEAVLGAGRRREQADRREASEVHRGLRDEAEHAPRERGAPAEHVRQLGPDDAVERRTQDRRRDLACARRSGGSARPARASRPRTRRTRRRPAAARRPGRRTAARPAASQRRSVPGRRAASGPCQRSVTRRIAWIRVAWTHSESVRVERAVRGAVGRRRGLVTDGTGHAGVEAVEARDLGACRRRRAVDDPEVRAHVPASRPHGSVRKSECWLTPSATSGCPTWSSSAYGPAPRRKAASRLSRQASERGP